MKFTEKVAVEITHARKKHAPIHSLHEGYAVILEEVCELWAEVMKRREQRDLVRIREELIQIAAMAQRTAEDVIETNPDFNGPP